MSASAGAFPAPGPSPAKRRNLRKVIGASLVGTSLEWYDFFLYGTAAALVFNELFFPEFDPLVGTLLAFATYAVGFVARPIGGIVFGHYAIAVYVAAALVITIGAVLFSRETAAADLREPRPDEEAVAPPADTFRHATP